MKLRTCVAPSGRFLYGIHRPRFKVENLREKDWIESMGSFADGQPCENHVNFPAGPVEETNADIIYEIPNPFPFKGTTYIAKSWADEKAGRPSAISLPQPPAVSFSDSIRNWMGRGEQIEESVSKLFETLPEPVLLAIAATSTDADELMLLADMFCNFIYDGETGKPAGLTYKKDEKGRARAVIENFTLFEILANNRFLPDVYKEVMVLRPGVQGGSEIVGEFRDMEKKSHVFEYLRRNSYIPWGHYAANMANDAIRYRISDLTLDDMIGMRHLYYQRTYGRMADQLGLPVPSQRRMMTVQELEAMRIQINEKLDPDTEKPELPFNCTLWGWNFGFDYSPSRYRLHASHQQVHQQFALIPSSVSSWEIGGDEEIPAYACGDMISAFIREYREQTGQNFFDAYIKAIRSNKRMDGENNRESSLVVYEDDHVMVFVPKAQTSQWELQLMMLDPLGNILETDTAARRALDRAMLIAVKALSSLGAKMITTIEYSKRFDSSENDQRLLYCFLPKMPESPGAFSEAQLRWINGHYPEDFATACREKLTEIPGDVN